MRTDACPVETTGAIALWARLRAEWLTVLTLGAAVAVPVTAARYLDHRIHRDLEPALSRATGVPTRVGGFTAGLTGNVTVHHLAVGELLTADSVEAAVSLDSLLAGELTPDEIRVTHPRLRAIADRDGGQAWRAVLARLAARRSGGHGAASGRRLRRIVVSGGDLVIDVPGLRIRAGDVEFHPSGHGVRVVTGAAVIDAERRGAVVHGQLARLGADLRLPSLTVERAAIVGGHATIELGAGPMRLDDLTLVHDLVGGPWRVTGVVDDGGAPRAVAVAYDPSTATVAIAGDRVPLAALAPRTGPLAVDHAHATGQLTVSRDPGLRLAGTITIAGAALDLPALAAGSIPLDATAEFAVQRVDDRLEVERLRLERGSASVTGHGWIRTGHHAAQAANLTLELPTTGCRDLVDALPAAVRGQLGELAVRGTIGGAAQAVIDLDAPLGEGIHLAVALANRCEVMADPPAADVHQLAGVAAHRFPDGRKGAVGPGVGDWVALAGLPGYVPGAFVAAEDARFWHHDGFDVAQIARSLEIDLREDRFARGGSTISQQLVKNAFLAQDRTLARKLEEAVLTWRLEAVLDKPTILARYLNVIELGPGVFGITAAAHHWFGRAPHQLTVRQAAFLAALTPAPRTLSARLAAAHRADADIDRRIGVVIRAMRRAGVITAATAHAAELAPLDLRPAALAR